MRSGVFPRENGSGFVGSGVRSYGVMMLRSRSESSGFWGGRCASNSARGCTNTKRRSPASCSRIARHALLHRGRVGRQGGDEAGQEFRDQHDRQDAEQVHHEGQQEPLAPRDGAVDALEIRLTIVEVEVHQELTRL